MNIGDLVRCDIGSSPDEGHRVGIITGFDKDDDPIVCIMIKSLIIIPFIVIMWRL